MIQMMLRKAELGIQMTDLEFLKEKQNLENSEYEWLEQQKLTQLVAIDRNRKDVKLFKELKTKYQATQYKTSAPSNKLVRQGKIELLESVELPEGVRVLVTVLPDNETEFWLQASQTSLNAVWDNAEDDVYAQLLQA